MYSSLQFVLTKQNRTAPTPGGNTTATQDGCTGSSRKQHRQRQCSSCDQCDPCLLNCFVLDNNNNNEMVMLKQGRQYDGSDSNMATYRCSPSWPWPLQRSRCSTPLHHYKRERPNETIYPWPPGQFIFYTCSRAYPNDMAFVLVSSKWHPGKQYGRVKTRGVSHWTNQNAELNTE